MLEEVLCSRRNGRKSQFFSRDIVRSLLFFFLYPILYSFLILNQVAKYNTTDHQSVGHTGNHAEFREIKPFWRIRGPVLVPKTRRFLHRFYYVNLSHQYTYSQNTHQDLNHGDDIARKRPHSSIFQSEVLNSTHMRFLGSELLVWFNPICSQNHESARKLS